MYKNSVRHAQNSVLRSLAMPTHRNALRRSVSRRSPYCPLSKYALTCASTRRAVFSHYPAWLNATRKRRKFSMNLKLVKAGSEYKKQICNMLDEWYGTGEKIIPYAIRKVDYHDFDNYCANIEVKDTSNGLVPDSTFFCLDTDRNIMVGAVNIRHFLNESLLLNGGHIGDGVVPSERRKGIATKMIALALEECRKLGIKKVLMVCDKENVGSAKSIQNNGGILENEIEVEGVVEQRYWIELV